MQSSEVQTLTSMMSHIMNIRIPVNEWAMDQADKELLLVVFSYLFTDFSAINSAFFTFLQLLTKDP